MAMRTKTNGNAKSRDAVCTTSSPPTTVSAKANRTRMTAQRILCQRAGSSSPLSFFVQTDAREKTAELTVVARNRNSSTT